MLLCDPFRVAIHLGNALPGALPPVITFDAFSIRKESLNPLSAITAALTNAKSSMSSLSYSRFPTLLLIVRTSAAMQSSFSR